MSFTSLTVSESVLALILSESARAHPHEACGILFGSPTRIDRAIVCANVHPDPGRHFEVDPVALIAAHKAARVGGERIAGYWHSHPSGEAAPSAADRAGASGDGLVWAIAAGEEIACWRDSPQGFEPLSYTARPR